MQGNYWLVQFEKNDDGKVCLKFYGRFYISAKHLICLITGLTAIGSAVSYGIHYFQ